MNTRAIGEQLLQVFYSSHCMAQTYRLPIQFGSLGFHVASQLLRALRYNGLQYGLPDFRLSSEHSWLPSEERQDFDNRLQCLSNDLVYLSDKLIRYEVLEIIE